MPPPYPVPCLVALLEQVNAAYPGRPKASDGWLGDAAHQARKSDHNPDPDGSVDARDITDWPERNLANTVVAALVASRDRRIKYIIWNGLIFKSYVDSAGRPAWVAQPYTGTNPHDHHFHISAKDEFENDTSPWSIAPTTQENPDMTPEQEAKLDRALAILDRLDADYLTKGKGVRQVIAEIKEALVRNERAH